MTSTLQARGVAGIFCLLFAAIVTGCQSQTSNPPTSAAASETQTAPTPDAQPTAIPSDPVAAPERDDSTDRGDTPDPVAPSSVETVAETWSAVFMQKSKVGYEHSIVTNEVWNEKPLLVTRFDGKTTMRRGRDLVSTEMRVIEQATPAGKLVQFESEILSGGGTDKTIGVVKGWPVDAHQGNDGQVANNVDTLAG